MLLASFLFKLFTFWAQFVCEQIVSNVKRILSKLEMKTGALVYKVSPSSYEKAKTF